MATKSNQGFLHASLDLAATIHSVEKGMNCRMDTKRKILLALGLRFEDKDHVFPPVRRMDAPEFPGSF